MNTRCGQGMIEYVLVISLVSIFVMALFLYFLPAFRDIYRTAMTPDTMAGAQSELSAGIY